MKTIGIIAEFNPFHNGHLHLIEYCRKELFADNIVVVMSGDFVQRGFPAIVDKFTRTRMALACGADLVLELPVYYSTSSAEYFAQGAVSVLESLDVVDQLVFGSECGDISLLKRVAEILNEEPPIFKETLSSALKEGLSFATARERSVLSCLNNNAHSSSSHESEHIDANSIASLVSKPNNILGIEYIKALLSRNSSID